MSAETITEHVDPPDAVEELLQERDELRWEGSKLLAAYLKAHMEYYTAGATHPGATGQQYTAWRKAKREYREWVEALIGRVIPVSEKDEEDLNAREAERQSQFKLRAP